MVATLAAIALLLVAAAPGEAVNGDDCRAPAKHERRDDDRGRKRDCTPTPTAIVPTVVVLPTATPTPWPGGAQDRFNRPDQPVLGRADSNQLWEELGDWAVCGRQACAMGPPDDGLFARVPTNLTSQRAGVTIAARPVGAAGQAGILAQLAPPWGTYFVYAGLTTTGRVELWVVNAFAWTEIASANTAFTSAQARRVEIRAGPGTASVYVAGQLVIGPASVPQPPPGATYAGIAAETTDPTPANWPRLDDFSVTRYG